MPLTTKPNYSIPKEYLGVKRIPLHAEDTEPFCCVGDVKVDPVITAVEKVRVVDKAFICKHEAGIGV